MRFHLPAVLLIATLTLPLAACGGNTSGIQQFDLTSPAFLNNQVIPSQYTCIGQGQQIPLAVSDLPKGTRSLALLMEDLDTKGPYVHWMAWNIPAEEGTLALTESGTVVSLNSGGKPGYAPPCPPEDALRPHRYHIQVYAVSRMLDAQPPLSRTAFKQILVGKVLGKGEITGTVQR